MTNKRATIKDVAKASGVSISTVSQILNGKSQLFSEKTVEKVMQAKINLNYQPDYFAQRMIKKESKTIGVIVPDIANPFFSSLIKGIEKVLYKKNFMTILCNADFSEEKEFDAVQELERRGVDGFIIASSSITNETINQVLRLKKIPFIVLDQKKAENYSDAVLTDDHNGGILAAQHLKQLGHEKVAVVIPENAPENIQNRFIGFSSVYPVDSLLIIHAPLSKEGGESAVAQIIAGNVSAIFAANDEIALGVYRGLFDSGKKIPEDYSVIGYDNIDICNYVTPRLTTIAQPTTALGETTAKMLLKRIDNESEAWEEIILPVHLEVRDSTRKK